MQGELSRLYYEYYRFAFDTARRAETTMKRELMRPELDDVDFVKFNYWDGGRKGLLAGERAAPRRQADGAGLPRHTTSASTS